MLGAAIEVIGWLGALTVTAAYLLFSTHRIPNGYLFQTGNLAGAAGMLANSVYHSAWPSATTSIIWCGIALWALTRLKQQHQDTTTEPIPAALGDGFLPPPGPPVTTGEIPCQGHPVEHHHPPDCAGQPARTPAPAPHP